MDGGGNENQFDPLVYSRLPIGRDGQPDMSQSTMTMHQHYHHPSLPYGSSGYYGRKSSLLTNVQPLVHGDAMAMRDLRRDGSTSGVAYQSLQSSVQGAPLMGMAIPSLNDPRQDVSENVENLHIGPPSFPSILNGVENNNQSTYGATSGNNTSLQVSPSYASQHGSNECGQAGAESMPTNMWRPIGIDTIGRANPNSNIEMELGDILSGSGDHQGTSASSGMRGTTQGEPHPSRMITTSFTSQVSSTTISSGPPSRQSNVSANTAHGDRPNSRKSASTAKRQRAVEKRTDRKVSSRPNMNELGDRGASESGRYNPVSTQLNQPQEEPDLSQEKIDQKNEKCQFHNCPNRARVSQMYGKFCNRHVIVAPCGFPGCRDRAVMNSSMCSKHLAQGKEALHKILANRAQNVPVCRTFGCFKNDQGRGYCRGHEKLLMATGRLPKHINKRRLNSAYTMCSYPGCNKHSQRHHLCRTHGNLIMKQAEELAKSSPSETYEEILSKLQKEIRRCTYPNCTKNSQRDRLCTIHYYERQNQNKDNSSSANTLKDALCSLPGCKLPSSARGLCHHHSNAIETEGRNSANVTTKRQRREKKCRSPGCHGEVFADEFCGLHYKETQITKMSSRHGLNAPANEPTTFQSENQDGCSNSTTQMQAFSVTQPSKEGVSVHFPVRNSILDSDIERIIPYDSGAKSDAATRHPTSVQSPASSCLPPSESSKHTQHENNDVSGTRVDAVTTMSSDDERGLSVEMVCQQPEACWNRDDNIPEDEPRRSCKSEGCANHVSQDGLCGSHSHSNTEVTDENPAYTQKLNERSKGGLERDTMEAFPRMRAPTPAFCQYGSNDSHTPNPNELSLSENTSAEFSASLEQEKDAKNVCRYPDCSFESKGSPLCSHHTEATLCWDPSCSELVRSPSFCDGHARNALCAVEGCSGRLSNRFASGCSAHSNATTCRHSNCSRFCSANSSYCRAHLMNDCSKNPCAICKLRMDPSGPEERGSDGRCDLSSLSNVENMSLGNNDDHNNRSRSVSYLLRESRLL